VDRGLHPSTPGTSFEIRFTFKSGIMVTTLPDCRVHPGRGPSPLTAPTAVLPIIAIIMVGVLKVPPWANDPLMRLPFNPTSMLPRPSLSPQALSPVHHYRPGWLEFWAEINAVACLPMSTLPELWGN